MYTENYNKKILNIVPKTKLPLEIKNGYYIIVKFMYGDADGYVEREMGPFNEGEMDSLFDAIETIERCINEYPCGRGGIDTYNYVKGWVKWFGEREDYEEYGDKSEPYICPPQAIMMERTPDNWGSQATFDDYKVMYYDNNQPYECEITWDK